jgi:hypothetical protein
MPLDIGAGSDMGFRVAGYEPRPGEELNVTYNRVGPNYFEAMGIPLWPAARSTTATLLAASCRS